MFVHNKEVVPFYGGMYVYIATRQIGASGSVLRFHCIQANLFDQFLIFTAVGFLHPIEEPSTGMILEL